MLWTAILLIIVAQYFLGGFPQLIQTVIGCTLGISLFYLARILSGKKLGLADVWFSGYIGAFLGPVWWYLAIAIACVATGIVCLGMCKRKVPFIPFLTVGTIVSLSISIIKA